MLAPQTLLVIAVLVLLLIVWVVDRPSFAVLLPPLLLLYPVVAHYQTSSRVRYFAATLWAPLFGIVVMRLETAVQGYGPWGVHAGWGALGTIGGWAIHRAVYSADERVRVGTLISQGIDHFVATRRRLLVHVTFSVVIVALWAAHYRG